MNMQITKPASRLRGTTKRALQLSLLAGYIFASVVYAAELNKQTFEVANFQTSKASSSAEAKRIQNALRKAAREERTKLLKLSDKQLVSRGKKGDTIAKLILAEKFASEAHTRALTIGAANAALSDALRWYSDAARRGYPGTPAIDKILLAIPIRVVK